MSFNSILVRLKDQQSTVRLQACRRFNSILVRLKASAEV